MKTTSGLPAATTVCTTAIDSPSRGIPFCIVIWYPKNPLKLTYTLNEVFE